MARILGLDLGSYAVRGVVFESNKRGGHATQAWMEVPRAQEGDRMETLKAALTELVTRNPLEFDQVIVALPGPSLVTHSLTLPFSDSKRVEAALPFEIEGQLPFDLSECVYDYQVVAQREKGADILVGVVRRDELNALLAVLHELKLDPRVVTHPGLAFQNLLLQSPQTFEPGDGSEALAVVDIGHERTTVAIGFPGQGVEVARTLSGGGKDLSRALANEFQTALPEAHHWKEAHGALASEAQGPDVERAAGAFVKGLQPLLRELRSTFKGYTARSRKQVGSVYVCGGTAKLPGLAEQLSKELGMPCRLLALPAEADRSVAPEAQPAFAQAYALGLRGQAAGVKAPRFNLRRGDMGFKGGYDFVKERIGILSAMAATLLLLLIASGIVRNSVLASREAEVDKQLCETTQRILGTCEKNYDRALNLLKGVESPTAALPKMSAANLLASMTSRVPSDLPVKFDRIQVDLGRISLQGETDSSKQIDTLQTALKKHPCFREINEGKVEKTRDGTKLSFRLDIKVQCPDAPEQTEEI